MELWGVLTLILEKLEFLAFSIRVGVHLLVTATILVLTSLFFGWGSALWSPLLWFFFLLIYGLIWLYQIWQTHKLTQRINQALEDKKTEKRVTNIVLRMKFEDSASFQREQLLI